MRRFHLRIADFAVATDLLNAAQCLDVPVVAGLAIQIAKILSEADIPVAELAFVLVPLRHDQAKPAEMLDQVEVPLLRAELETHVLAENVELRPIR